MSVTIAQLWALGKWAYRLEGRVVEAVDVEIGAAEMPPEWTADQPWHNSQDWRPTFTVRDFDDATGISAEELHPVLVELCDRLLQLVAEDGLDIRSYPGHAGRHSCEMDEDSVGILAADWNNPLAAFIGDLWELRGGDVEWSDGGTECEGCQGFVQTQPDCYGWEPQFAHLPDGGVMCTGCLADEEEVQRAVLDEHINNPRAGVRNQFSLEPHGFTEVKEDCETGFHSGQDDDPTVVMKKLRAAGCKGDVLFRVDSTGQFDALWSVWYRPEGFDPACDDLDDLETDADLVAEVQRAVDALTGGVAGHSPAEAMKAALLDAARQEEAAGPAPAGFVRCVTTNADGTATVRDIPHDEFIKGGFTRQ